jgi:hypothetical protein
MIEYNDVLLSVEDKLRKQTEKGFKKYGTIVNPDRLPTVEWIDHAQEEIIDLLVYLECLKYKVYHSE